MFTTPRASTLASTCFLLCLAVTTQAAAPTVPAPPAMSAEGYLLIDAGSGTTLLERNADQRMPPASLTKIMTSYVVGAELERGFMTLDDETVVSVKAWKMEGSRMFIKEGTSVSVRDLLRGIIIQSGNDASVAVAEHTAGDEAAFADLMNQYARNLDMTDTHFVNATGLPDDNHYTTARDLARLTVSHIKRFPALYRMYSEREFTWNKISQPNRNRLLWRDLTVDGVKTGFTDAAGYCLVASAKRGDTRLISVVMGAGSDDLRFSQTQKLLTYGFRYYETAWLYEGRTPLNEVRLWQGQQDTIQLGLSEDFAVTVPKGTRDKLKAEMDIPSAVRAPLEAGDEVGTLTVTLPNGDIVSMPILALSAVDDVGIMGSLWDSIALFFLYLTGGDPLAIKP